MTEVVFFRTKDQQITGFESRGHSGCAYDGEDIVCAGISALVVTALNSIDQLTDAQMTCEEDPEQALIRFETDDYICKDVQLLLQSLLLGLTGIEQSYGSSFIEVSFKEVE